MLELGPQSEAAHINIANEIKELQLDAVIFVGPEMRLAYEHLKKSVLGESIQWFKSSILAIQAARKLFAGNTAMLVKGSRGMQDGQDCTGSNERQRTRRKPFGLALI